MRPKNIAKEEAIRAMALKIIAEEGLENLSMQKLATAANISPRTIYLKYENKEDLLIKLFVEEVLGDYEKAVLQGFSETMDFATGVRKLWENGAHYLMGNRPSFVLMQYGKSSPLLNKGFQEKNIQQGHFFGAVHRWLDRHASAGLIRDFPMEVHRAFLLSPLLDLVNEYFEYADRPIQIITDKVLAECCEMVIRAMLTSSNYE
jgi:TetR/AcrR family transcriptional regulator, multidrug resistance operon repressor